MTQRFDDMARRRNALYQAGSEWIPWHPLEYAFLCDVAAQKCQRMLGHYIDLRSTYLAECDKALSDAAKIAR